MTMNVLVLADTFPNRYQPWQGPYNRRQFECLARDCGVTAIAPTPWPKALCDKRFRQLSREADCVIPGVTIHHPLFWYAPVIGRGRTWRGILNAARRALRRTGADFDVVVATFAYPHGLAARELARELGIPYVIKARGSDLHALPPSGPRRQRTAEAVRDADAVVAVAGNLARIARDLGAAEERVHVLPNGIDAGDFTIIPREAARERLALPTTGKLALFVGSLLPVKGIDTLLAALQRPSLEGMGLTLAMAGQGPLAQLIRDAATANQAVDIRLLGHASRDEVALWMNAADCLVLPSRNEGCPNVVLEALACGTPVVATEVGAVPDLLDAQCGRMAPAGNSGALATALAETLKDKWNRNDIRMKVAHRSWEENAKTLRRILEGVVTQHAII